jgi:uncharacterized protein YbaR (Trm112 family)
MVTDSQLKLLRCIWLADREHQGPGDLYVAVDGPAGLLACHGCGASFLVLRDIPILLEDDQLTPDERAELTRVREVFSAAGRAT